MAKRVREKFEINSDARWAVYERSQGICERCYEKEAVHVHHLTYKRAGHEWPEDLQHICLGCHCLAHPYKADEILNWELQRRARMAAESEDVEVETEEERWAMELDEDELEEERLELAEEKHEEREREKQRERERPEPAWNLKRYVSSGYCLEDIEREEGIR